jgi:outer membrane receptor for ferrienterochelin and colicins
VFESGKSRAFTHDLGLYTQGKLRFTENQNLILGLRVDHHRNITTRNKYTPLSIRGGYVANFDRLGFKALYGEAFQEPSSRMLYSGWAGAGANPNLKPEKSRTVEGSVSYTLPSISNLVSVYYVKDSDTIATVSNNALNLGERDVMGLDYHLQAQLSDIGLKNVRAWLYYSRLFKADEQKFNAGSNSTGTGKIGDLAYNKLWLGSVITVTQDFTTALRGRWMGHRPTVDSNPVGTVNPYAVFDTTFTYRDLFAKNFVAALSVNNVFNAQYMDPGIAVATGGVVPNSLNSNYYNSLLPQPGRAFFLSGSYEF